MRCLFLWVVAAMGGVLGGLGQEALYVNRSPTGTANPQVRYAANEFGDEIDLKGGAAARLGAFGVSYYGDFNLGVRATAVVRLYRNDGPDVDPTTKFVPAPGTLLLESAPRDLVRGYGEILLTDLALDVPGRLTFTVQFFGLSGREGDRAGLLFENSVSVGRSFDDFWERQSAAWQISRFGGNPVANFGARAFSVGPSFSLAALADVDSPMNLVIRVPLTIRAEVPDAGVPTVSATADNLTLFPSGAVTVEGQGLDRTVVLTPARDLDGQATVTVRVTGAVGSAATRSFVVRVNRVEPLVMTTVPDQQVLAGTSTGDLPVRVTGLEANGGFLSATLRSSNTELVPDSAIVGGGDPQTGEFLVRVGTRAGVAGETVISIIVRARSGASVSGSFRVVASLPVLPEVSVAVVNTPVSEVGGVARFRLTRTGDPKDSLTVGYSIDGTATPGLDHEGRAGSVVFDAGIGVVEVAIPVLDDALLEPDETLVLVVVAGAGYVLAPAFQAVAVVDDDESDRVPPFITLQPADAKVPEGAEAVFLVRAASASTLSYQWRVNGVAIEDGPSHSGSRTARLTVLKVAQAQLGFYDVVISNPFGAVTSTRVRLELEGGGAAPEITGVADVRAQEGAVIPLVRFNVADSETALADLRVWVVSSDEGLLAPEGLTLGGAGFDRTLEIRPTADRSGQATVSLVVSDGFQFTVTQFRVIIEAVNQRPLLSPFGDLTLTLNTTGRVDFVISDRETAADRLVVTTGVSSLNAALFPEGSMLVEGSGGKRTLVLVPGRGETGVAIVGVAVSDGLLAVTNVFRVTVTRLIVPVNTAPVLSVVPDQQVGEGRSVGPLPFSVQDAETEAGLLRVFATSSNVKLISPDDIVLLGRGTNRAVYLSPVSDALGTSTITLWVTDGELVVSNAFAVRVVGSAPLILQQPEGRTVKAGATVLLTGAAKGSAPLEYQWARNGTPIPGATGSSYQLVGVTAAMSGSYTLTARNAVGSATSRPAVVVVVELPRIVEHPQSVEAAPGSRVELRVAAEGTGPFQYQWRHNGNAIRGATQATLVLASLEVREAGVYDCAVSSPLGAATSDRATVALAVGGLVLSDSFAAQITITEPFGTGRGSTLLATREAGEPLHAGKRGGRSVWASFRAPTTGVAVFDTRGSSFDTLLAVYTGDAVGALTLVASDDDRGESFFTSRVRFNTVADTLYRVAVDGLRGAAGAVVLSWNLQATPNRVPLFTVQPADLTVTLGASAVFTAQAVHPLGQPTYQWNLNGNPVAGATAATLTLPSVGSQQVGLYTVDATLGGETARSRDAKLEVNVSDVAAGREDVASEDKFFDTDLQGDPPPGPPWAWASGRRIRPEGGLASGYTGTQVFATTTSTTETGEPVHCGVTGGASQWFAYEAAGDGELEINTDGSSFDTILAVYTGPGDSFETLTEVTCDNNGGTDGQDSLVSFTATAGTVYYVVVDGVSGANGEVQLNYRLRTPVTISSVRIENGQFVVRFTGRVGATMTVQVTTDLSNWYDVQESIPPNGVLDFVDPEPAGSVRRYYRALVDE